ncbi:unnamed protein product [Cylindrotheca closterium]|uniref:Uncharacterized protein n=1 Tax=Cylindrotheca closterium TaxID=2856 RepID=A0AAD2CMD2_9STRA|nr:unnamed protein product [Cylindrotheca closterium]
MKLSFIAPIFMAMGASAFQSAPITRSNTALHSSSPMGGPPPPQTSGPAGSAPPMQGGASGGLAGVNRGPSPRDGPGPDATPPILLQGGSLKTWSMPSTAVQSCQIFMETEGRPLDANLELWQGPDNTPYKMRIYVEDGAQRCFNVVVPAPRGPNTIAIRNTAQLEFPLLASVNPSIEMVDIVPTEGSPTPRTIQGGALRTYPFNPDVQSVKVMLSTDGRPLNSRIELLQGPNNIKQVMELYTEDGLERPFLAMIETPGAGNVVRIVNTATMEFPLICTCEAHIVGPEKGMGGATMGDELQLGSNWMY